MSSFISAMTRLESRFLVISSRAFSGIMSGQSQTIYCHTGCYSKLLSICFICCIWWCERLDNRENIMKRYKRKKTHWVLLLLVRVFSVILRVHQTSKSMFHYIVFECTFRLTLVTDYTMCSQQFQQRDFKQSRVKQQFSGRGPGTGITFKAFLDQLLQKNTQSGHVTGKMFSIHKQNFKGQVQSDLFLQDNDKDVNICSTFCSGSSSNWMALLMASWET